MAAETIDDLKYVRVGYVDQNRKSDHLLASVLRQLPGDGRLPLRWKYSDVPSFVKKYGELGSVLWAPALNSHLLVVNGHKIVRVWTDTATHCQVDLNDAIVAGLTGTKLEKEIADIPAGNVRKCKPFTKRVRIHQQFQANILVDAIKRTYGLHHP